MPPVQRAAALTALLLAVLAPGASAQSPVVLGTGETVTAVTDAVGTLHAVWRQRSTNDVLYCRLPAGGTACTPVALAPTDPRLPKDPWILVRRGDGALFVLQTGLEGPKDVTYLRTSTDGGTTWSAPALAARGQYDIDHAQLTADGTAVETLYGIGPQGRFQRVPLDGRVEERFLDLSGGERKFVLRNALARLPGGGTVAVGSNGTVFGTRRLGAGDPHAEASWTPWPATPALKLNDAQPAGGPTGTFLLGNALGDLRLYRLQDGRWRRPRTLGNLAAGTGGEVGTSSTLDKLDLASDPAGRLHALWTRPRRDCGGFECIVYRRTEPRDFAPEVVYPVTKDASEPVVALQAAPNEGGSGWLVAVQNDPRAEGGNVIALPLVTPPRGSRVGSRVLGRRTRVTLPARPGCVPAGGRFVHRVDVTGRRDGVRILRVRFSFDDGRLVRTDRRAPFRQTYVLGFPAGSRHVARAEVTYRFAGRTRRAGIGRAIVMCP